MNDNAFSDLFGSQKPINEIRGDIFKRQYETNTGDGNKAEDLRKENQRIIEDIRRKMNE